MTKLSIQEKWLTDYYSSLVGFLITDFRLSNDDDGDWPIFTVEKGDEKFEVEVSRDEEGNGPGFLFGLPTPN